MLAPRFSIRTLLMLVTGGAVIFLVAGMAVRGEQWAWGITIAVFSMGLVLFANAVWFGLVALFALLLANRRGKLADKQGNPPFVQPTAEHRPASPIAT